MGKILCNRIPEAGVVIAAKFNSWWDVCGFHSSNSSWEKICGRFLKRKNVKMFSKPFKVINSYLKNS